MAVTITVTVSISVTVVAQQTSSGQSYSVSSNGRYLENPAGDPFLLLSSSPQGMLVAVSTTDMETYLSAMHDHGINCVQVHVISGQTFGGGANFETYDDVHPFTVDGDISTPNNTYFSRLDTLVSLAEDYEIIVFMSVADMIDADHLWKTNGNTKCYNYGAYLGNRYKDAPNIFWMVGNDFQDWRTDTDSVTALVNIINGIKSADTNHSIHSAWLDYYVSASRDSTDFDELITLDFGYTYWIVYDKIAAEYALNPAKPVFLGETYYQDYYANGITGTPFHVRKQNYWAMLAGACGVTVMNDNWNFHTGWATEAVNKECFTEVTHLKNLFTAYNWWELVPDTTNQILTAGYGTKRTGTIDPNTDDYANCAYLADGSLAIIYMPENLTMTVDMSKFSGTVTCRWFDPTDGSYTADAASPHTNSGTHDFSRATANSTGGTDWLLVLSV